MGLKEFFFGKKQKGNAPSYSAKLIPKFYRDHEVLLNDVNKIKKILDNATFQDKEVKKLLQSLKMKVLGHFMEEDIKLYWYLKEYYKENQSAISTVNSFESSIKEIQKSVMHFFDYYSREDIPLDKEFVDKFFEISDALAARIESEEQNLYTLYLE